MSINALLNLGGNAILAHNAGVATAGKNIANVNTEGYQRELLDLRATAVGAPILGGVRIVGPYRVNTLFLARREEDASGQKGYASASARALEAAERAVGGATGSDLVDAISELWGGMIELSAAPLDLSTREKAVNAARRLTTVFQRAAENLERERDDADSRLTALAAEATELAATISDLNHAITVDPGRDPALHDRRDLAARKLAEIMGGSARIDPDGMMRFVVAGGVVVVDGTRSATVTISAGTAPSGYGAIEVIDGDFENDVTATLDGGKMAGEVRMRDVVAADAASDLDALALSLANAVNTQHAAGIGLTDATSRNLFVSSSGAITAATLGLSSDIDADPRLLAAAAAGSGTMSPDNTNALALAALRTSLTTGGGSRTATDEAIRILGAVGQAAANAQKDEEVEDGRVASLAELRDSLSGVSIEEEMTRLAAFRNAAEAAATFVSTVDELLRDLVERL